MSHELTWKDGRYDIVTFCECGLAFYGSDVETTDRKWARHKLHVDNRHETFGDGPCSICKRILDPVHYTIDVDTNDIVLDEGALHIAQRAVEDTLTQFREEEVGVRGPTSGFVIRDENGRPSAVMRMGTRDGLAIGIQAYLKAAQQSLIDTLRKMAE